MTVRTRIAPSPTGELHIGHMRTILYDYAFAKKHGGQFIVRIEDTDRNRFVEGSMERTLQTIKDYGLSWDEGPLVGGAYEPYLQSQRLDIYKKHAEELVKNGFAYYCFCTPERLQELREKQQAEGAAKTSYDKRCRYLSSEEVQKNLEAGMPHVIRLKVPENETVALTDEIHGTIEFDTNEVDDAVLLKSDGYPTYHLAAMVDDHLMNITHVLRGIDWMPSAPIHLLIFKAFGWESPKFAHLPNLKEKGMNAKLSKRYGAVAAADFLKDGYLPKALLNFLMFVGWNPGTEKEIYSLEEFIQDFSLEKVQSADLVAFDRDKLLWFNGVYIRETPTEELLSILKNWANKHDYKLNISGNDSFDIEVFKLVQDRMKTLADFNELTSYFYQEPSVSKELITKQSGDPERSKEILSNFVNLYDGVNSSEWNKENLDKISHELLEKSGYKPKEAFMTLRVAITGVTATPPIFDIIQLLGKDKVLPRIRKSL